MMAFKNNLSSSRKQYAKNVLRTEMQLLLECQPDEILRKLNSSKGGIEDILKKGIYVDLDMEIMLYVIVKACTSRSAGGVQKLLRMLDTYRFLQEAILNAIHRALTGKSEINLTKLITNYLIILKNMIKKLSSFEIVDTVFPQVQNYINRMKSERIPVTAEMIADFEYLEKKLMKHEQNRLIQESSEQNPPENFRKLPVVPVGNDIINCKIPFLRPNIINDSYNNVEHYLDIHFRLMREDMLRTFRKCISEYRTKNSKSGMDFESGQMYENIKVKYPPEYSVFGILYCIDIEMPKAINWEGSKRLLPGSLLCFTNDKFHTVTFVTVKEREPLRGYNKNCKIKVVVENTTEELLHKQNYVVVETDAYFESYRHILSAMKDLTEVNFPLSDCLVTLDYEDSATVVLSELPFSLHEKCSNNSEESPETSMENVDHPCKTFNVLDLNEWPSSEELKLDEHQLDAFKVALTKKVSLIQGPPGTGKTYLGVKIVSSFLQNLPSTSHPIVIICLTNHALDQFLEHILKYTQKIIRLGSQSKSEVLKPYVMSNIIQSVRSFRFDGENCVYAMNDTNQKALKVAFSLIKDIAITGSRPEYDSEFMQLRNLCAEINKLYSLYLKTNHDYFDDEILNSMIEKSFKEMLLKNAGSNANVLKRNVKEWLSLSGKDEVVYLKCKEKWQKLNPHKVSKENTRDLETEESAAIDTVEYPNIWELALDERFRLFYTWRKEYSNVLANQLTEKKLNYNELLNMKSELNSDICEFLMKSDIIGMTTTGAAKYRDYMKIVKPQIMIVEEAAEVLESHIISSLVPSIKQLILIGDHEQLRPLPADHDLATVYNLNISLFERLFKNGAPSATLISQHRMRPCIAELLVPNIYSSLESDRSVYEYDEIKGILHNMYFFQHEKLENKNSSGKSSSNEFEAQFLSKLSKYLIQHGYDQSQITILTTYAGQLPLLKRYLDEDEIFGLHVTTVDNYQGEENDIILISFVRSNKIGVIGFLKETNRICVALSRARKGLYCIGNFKLYAKKSELWASLVEKLESCEVIGDAFPLECPNHKNNVNYILNHDGFIDYLNGCLLPCNYILPCEHQCPKSCHLEDPFHSHIRCHKPCERMIDKNGSLVMCQKLCSDPCQQKKKSFTVLKCGHRVPVILEKDYIDYLFGSYQCMVETPHFLLCRHSVTLPCYIDIKSYQCTASVPVILPCGHEKGILCYLKGLTEKKAICNELVPYIAPCGHTVEVPCSEKLDDNQLLAYCTKSCDALLKCGHPCTGSCQWCFDTKIHAMCLYPCTLKLPCGHTCQGKCNAPCPPCEKKCDLRCTHSHCVNHCARPCVKCKQPCTWQCVHNQCRLECWKNCEGCPCEEPCVESLPCGHSCVGFCGEPCPNLCRICHQDMLKFSENPQNDRFVLLEDCDCVIEVKKLTSHIESLLSTFDWPDCPVCNKSITKSVRFGKQLRKAKHLVLVNADTSEKREDLLFLLRTMFGDNCRVTWRFQDVHHKILQILEHDKPSLGILTVLELCVKSLKVLIKIDEKLVDISNDTFECQLDTLLLWICGHLGLASYQQLDELYDAVQVLKRNIYL